MEITHDTKKYQFLVELEGYIAHVDYVLVDGSLDIRHTVVPKAIGGRGIASALVKAAFDYALAQGLKPTATCSYAADWLLRHPQYGSI